MKWLRPNIKSQRTCNARERERESRLGKMWSCSNARLCADVDNIHVINRNFVGGHRRERPVWAGLMRVTICPKNFRSHANVCPTAFWVFNSMSLVGFGHFSIFRMWLKYSEEKIRITKISPKMLCKAMQSSSSCRTQHLKMFWLPGSSVLATHDAINHK